jgi:hypothetical protein
MARPGPFPGMDPWIESRWEGFHLGLIASVQSKLNARLPDDLVARIDERVYVGYPDGGRRQVKPDVFVIEDRARSPAAGPPSAGTAVLDEPVTEGYIEIVDADDGATVITSVEILSPTNKNDPRARREYVAKRDEYHRATVSTVEIDLLRAGEHLVDVPPGYLPERLDTPYKVCVRRGWRLAANESEWYAVPLRSRLPRVRVPLRPTDADVGLDLQAAFEQTYVRGRYDRTRYDRPPVPPLGADDAAWAADRVAAWRAAAAAAAAGG